MKVEVFSDKFVTKANPSGRAVIDPDDRRVRKLLGEKVIEELLGRQAEEEGQVRSAEPKKSIKRRGVTR